MGLTANCQPLRLQLPGLQATQNHLPGRARGGPLSLPLACYRLRALLASCSGAKEPSSRSDCASSTCVDVANDSATWQARGQGQRRLKLAKPSLRCRESKLKCEAVGSADNSTLLGREPAPHGLRTRVTQLLLVPRRLARKVKQNTFPQFLTIITSQQRHVQHRPGIEPPRLLSNARRGHESPKCRGHAGPTGSPAALSATPGPGVEPQAWSPKREAAKRCRSPQRTAPQPELELHPTLARIHCMTAPTQESHSGHRRASTAPSEAKDQQGVEQNVGGRG